MDGLSIARFIIFLDPWINAGYLTDNRLPVKPDINLTTQNIRHICPQLEGLRDVVRLVKFNPQKGMQS